MKSSSYVYPRTYHSFMEVADALNYLHTCKDPIMHRDIKPENIMLSNLTPGSNPQAKLVDFGLAKKAKSNNKTHYTHGGNNGTLRYMAPELLQNGIKSSYRVDLYAFGITFWEIIMRAEPYNVMDVSNIPAHVLVTSPTPPTNPGYT